MTVVCVDELDFDLVKQEPMDTQEFKLCIYMQLSGSICKGLI